MMRGVRIEVSSEAARGRRAVAAASIQPGKVALETPAFAAVLLPECRGRRCDRCFLSSVLNQGETLKRCSKCKATFYCGAACQHADWSDHKVECSRTTVLAGHLERLGLTGPGALNDAILVGRCLRSTSRIGTSQSKATENIVSSASGETSLPPQTLNEMESLEARMQPTELEQLKGIAQAVADTPGLLPPDITAAEALDALCRFRNNNFAILDDLFLPVGAGVFPRGAALNHSCAPNCVVNYSFAVGKTPSQLVRVVEKVQAGDELTHSYVDLSLPTWQRKQHLFEGYGFTCQCALCHSDQRSGLESMLVSDREGRGVAAHEDPCCPLPLAPPCRERDSALRAVDGLMQVAAAEEDAIKELQMLEEVCSVRETYLHPHHIEVIAAHASAHTAAMAAADWTAAARHCQKLVEHYLKVYPKWHPITGLQMYTLGELSEHINRVADANKWYQHALSILQISHGQECKFAIDLAERLAENNSVTK